MPPQHTPRTDHCIATNFHVIANNRPQFHQTRFHLLTMSRLSIDANDTIAPFHIRNLGARAQMRAKAKNSISRIIHVRNHHLIEEQALLEFGAMPDHTLIPHDHVGADVGMMTDLAIAANDRRPENDSSRFNASPLSNRYVFPHKGGKTSVYRRVDMK